MSKFGVHMTGTNKKISEHPCFEQALTSACGSVAVLGDERTVRGPAEMILAKVESDGAVFIDARGARLLGWAT